MFNPRLYQRKAINAALTYINGKSKKRPIIVEAVGAGKTVTIANIIIESNLKTIILQPNKELLQQNYEKYLDYGFTASIYCASLNKKELSDVVFATIGSIVKIADEIAELGYGF